MKVVIEDSFQCEFGSESDAIDFVKEVGLIVNRDGCFVRIVPQDFEVEVATLEGLLLTLEQNGIDHTLCLVVPGTWYLDLF